jgi:hypothetical protein
MSDMNVSSKHKIAVPGRTAVQVRRLALGILLVAGTASSGAADRTAAIGVKGRANSYASLAASGTFAAIAWGARASDDATDIYIATSTDGGRAFGAPSRVNAMPGDASLSGEQPPRVSLIPREKGWPSIVVVWTSKAPAGTRLLSARSDDAGRSFTSPVPVAGSEASGNRGWQSIATTPDGNIVALWLDHRDSASSRAQSGSGNHEEHQHLQTNRKPADGVARAQLSRLFFATLGKTDSPRSLTGGVCYCCKTAIATDASGGVYAAWRHVYPGNVRDIAFSKSADGGRTFTSPIRISDDNWVLDGCPENGPALAVDRRQRIHIVWPTLVPAATPGREPTLALFYATSQDGRRFTARQQIPTEGVPRHPQIVLGKDGAPIVVWDEQARGTRHVALARASFDAYRNARFVRHRIGDNVRAEYPALATVDDATLVVWTSGTAGQTQLLMERLMN